RMPGTGRNPVGVDAILTPISQGSSCLATLGFGAESLWDSQSVATDDLGNGKGRISLFCTRFSTPEAQQKLAGGGARNERNHRNPIKAECTPAGVLEFSAAPAGAESFGDRFRWFLCASPPANFCRASGARSIVLKKWGVPLLVAVLLACCLG